MSSLPTIYDPDNYESQSDHNNEKMIKLLEELFPELNIPYDSVFQILSYLEETKVNPAVLPRVIRGIYNLTIGTGKGQVIVHVKQSMTNVQIRETDEEISTKY